jgi:hypothetical protein
VDQVETELKRAPELSVPFLDYMSHYPITRFWGLQNGSAREDISLLRLTEVAGAFVNNEFPDGSACYISTCRSNTPFLHSFPQLLRRCLTLLQRKRLELGSALFATPRACQVGPGGAHLQNLIFAANFPISSLAYIHLTQLRLFCSVSGPLPPRSVPKNIRPVADQNIPGHLGISSKARRSAYNSCWKSRIMQRWFDAQLNELIEVMR